MARSDPTSTAPPQFLESVLVVMRVCRRKSVLNNLLFYYFHFHILLTLLYSKIPYMERSQQSKKIQLSHACLTFTTLSSN